MFGRRSPLSMFDDARIAIPQEITALANSGSMMPQPMPQDAYKRPKRTLSDNLGLLADAFKGTNTNGQMLMSREHDDREAWAAQQAAQLKRATEFSDWQQRYDYERQNPKASNNDTVADYNFIAQNLGAEAAAQYLKSVAAGPPVAVDGIDTQGNQTRTYMPRGQLYGSAAPQRPPAGVTFTPIGPAGGATPSGSRPFR